MSTAKQPIKRLGLLATLLALTVLLLGAAQAQAAVGPQWKIDSMSNTTAAPGEEFEYIVEARNVGDEDMDGSQITLTATLPTGLVAVSGKLYRIGVNGPEATEQGGQAPLECDVVDSTHLECVNSTAVPTAEHQGNNSFQRLRLEVEVEPGTPEGILIPSFEVSGGGAAAGASTIDPTRISSAPLGFGIDAFDNQYLNSIGQPETAAGAHPADLVTSFDINSHTELDSHAEPLPLGGTARPIEPLKDASVELPPGFVGNPTVAPQPCLLAQLSAGNSATECPPSSQVGTVLVRYHDHAGMGSSFRGPQPVFVLEAPPGVAARFGFNVAGTIVVLDASIRSDGDYGITTGSTDTSEGLPVVGATFDLWANPFSEEHRSERACPSTVVNFLPAFGAPSCSAETAEAAFLRNPTSCEGPQPSTIHADSWFHPGVVAKETSLSHANPGYPSAPGERGPELGFEGCAAVPFSPSLEAGPPSGAQAGKPAAFSFDLKMPQEGLMDAGAISESDLRKAVVTLPAGVRVNPSSADGLGSCSPAQVALVTPVGQADAGFETEQTDCPESSKIGTLMIKTPLLDHEIPGGVYLAQQSQNPFGSLLALYLIADDPQSGVHIVLPGRVDTDPRSGQITTSFDENPQLPFEALHLELKGGQRSALTTPDACATYTTHSTFTGWSGKVVEGQSSFQITQGCGGGFDPKLSAGTRNPLAGSFSPFSLRLTREDGMQEIARLDETLAKGLIGAPKGIPYCPDAALASFPAQTILGTGKAQEAQPGCPPASRLGTVTVGAGSGTTPFYTQSGKAYLAGPYKGAPLSIAVLVPAVAGPFDLGTVLVRNAVHVDPQSAQVSVSSDPFPTILHGIPIDLRDVRVDLGRPGFTLNPTSCEPAQITSTVTSAQGAIAHPAARFQAANCDRLGFKPKLALRLGGSTRRTGNPALRAILTARGGDANIGRVVVALPHSEFLDQAHIKTVCTRVQFAAAGGGGAACPPGSVYGKVSARSPLVDYPLTGNVYLRSSDHPLPDLVLALRGPASQPLAIDAVGRIDSKQGGIRTTFAGVPDAPLSKLVLDMPGGRKSLLENSTNLCRRANRAAVDMDAQNGKARSSAPALRVSCGAAKKHKAGKGARG